MKIITRFSKSNLLYSLSIVFSLLVSQSLSGQTISATNGRPNCADCTPPGWTDEGGTPDVSNAATAAATGTGGGSATWVDAPNSTTVLILPLPPNGHNNWLSLRDLGGGGVEEEVSTTLGGLTIGRTYEVIAYSLTAVTDDTGQNDVHYSNTYNDFFTYQLGALAIQQVSPISVNTWSTSRFRFVASNTSETLTVRPGNNSAATGVTDSDFELFETVQVSITLNAINTVPVADDNSDSTVGTIPVTFDVTSTDVDFDGNIDDSTVDLDPSTTGIQNSETNSQGTWTVDGSGNVTFTAAQGFFGDATINYTVNDDYTLDGLNQSSTSNQATLTVTVAAAPSIEVTKVASVTDNDGSGTNSLGDEIEYTITLENTGNVVLDEITITDTLEDFNANGLTLTSGPTFDSADPGSSATVLEVGDTSTFIATYIIQQDAVDSGGVNNSVLVEADPPSDMTISDTTDSPVQTIIPRNPEMRAFKTFTTSDTNMDGTLGVDDFVNYIITIENTGNVTLTDVNIVDTLFNFNGAPPLNFAFGPVLIDGNPNNLVPGARVRYQARYVITQDDVDSGGLSNSVEASAEVPSGTRIIDISDDNIDDDNNVDDPTITLLPQDPSLEVIKVVSQIIDNGDGITGIGDIVNYTITIENTGNVFLENISILDSFQDLNGNPIQYNNGNEITFIEATEMSPEGELNVDEQASYTASYTLTQSDVNAGGISNSVLVSANSLAGDDVSDVSDDGNPADTSGDGNPDNDPTITTIALNPELEITKTQTIFDNGDSETGVDDVVSYNIIVENTGNVDLDVVNFVDTFTAADGNPLLDAGGNPISLNIIFSSATSGSNENLLLVGGTLTYTATFLLSQNAVDRGGIINSFRLDATGPDGTAVFDVSDDGNPADTDGDTIPDNDPTVLLITPDPSIEVVKEENFTDNGDGVRGVGDLVTYNITVENTGNVTIDNIDLTDFLEDLNGVAITPAPTINYVNSDMGSVQGSLMAGETATYSASYTLTQSDVDAGGISNSIVAEGMDPADNDITDVSDDGNPIDTDGDGNPDNDPTETIINPNPDIEVTKVASIADNGDEVLGVNDIITYTITVVNTGNVVLTNVNITDTLTDFLGNGRDLDTPPEFQPRAGGSPEGTLLVGETATYVATYVIEQRDVNAGGLINFVRAIGESPNGTFVEDLSDDGDDLDGNTEDDPTETITPEFPSVETIKVAEVDDNGDGELGPGDIVTFTITIENTGNVNLNNVSLVDTLTDLNGNPLSFSPGLEPTFVEADMGSPEGILLVGEFATYSATFVLTQDEIDAGGISNTALASGTSPFGIDIEDRSDDGNPADTDGDGDPDNDPTVVAVPEDPSLETIKTADIVDNGDGFVGVGDTVNYTITVENTGNVTITLIDLVDTLTNLDGDTLTLNPPGVVYQGSNGTSDEGTLLPGEIANYSASYTITQDDFDSGGLSNTATTSGETILGTPVIDVSDDGNPADTDGDGDGGNDPTETFFPSIEITKTFSIEDNGDGILGPGDEIVYEIIVTNDGLIDVTSISLVDTITDFLGNPRTLDSGPDLRQGSTDLGPGESATFEARYTITVDDVIAGGIRNSVDGTVEGPDGGIGTDTSDDGDDSDGNTEDDPTETPIPELVSLEAIKMASLVDDGDGVLGAGDTIEYTITVENTGNITVINITLNDVLTNFEGTVLAISGPTFDFTVPIGGIEGILLPGQTATYTASYTLTQDDVDSGGVSNTVLVDGDSPLGTDVTDTSDDGNPADTDGDGDGDNDPTETVIPEVLELEVIKTASVFDDSDGTGVGDEITYTIQVTNTGNVTVNGITIDDTLTDFNGNVLNLNGPNFDAATSDNIEGTLSPGQFAFYTATYTITQDDVDAGGVSNTATASGTSSGGNPVDDVSDDGDPGDADGDGDPENDPTDVPIQEIVELEVIKTASVFDDSDGIGVGDEITYTIQVTNTGNVTINGITISDTLTDFNDNPLSLDSGPSFDPTLSDNVEGTLAPGETATYSATYTITQDDVDAGGVSNSATASGTSAGGTPVDDVSDDGDPNDTDGDGDPDNDPTDIAIPENISIEVIKTFTVDDADGILGASDTINYEIVVTNTGNVSVSITDLVDTITNFNGDVLSLDADPVLSDPDATILPGESVTYNASYTITQDDVDSGGVRNTVLVNGEGDGSGTPVDDVSDDGDPNDTDGDGDPDNDPTETPIPESPNIEVIKTFTINNLGSEVIGAGDIIEYEIAIENTGNVTITIDNITDTIEDFLGNTLTLTSLPIFNRSSDGSPEGTILPGETAIYVATYIITQSDVDAGGVSNSVFVEGSTGTGTDTDDTSDDGDPADTDGDGDPDNDPTDTIITEVIAIETIKTADVEDTNNDGFVGVGDVITYEITVTNVGNKNVFNISLTDTFTDLLGNSLNFDVDPGFTVFDLLPDEEITFTATYTITQSDVDAGGVSNTVLASGEDEDRNPVDDVSDDGDPADTDGDGDPDNDPTDTLTDDGYDLAIDKVVDVQEPLVGDDITFTITISNNGLITANNIVVSDILPSGYVFVSSVATAGNYSDLSGDWTIDTLAPGEIEMLEITVEVLGFGDYLNTATITGSDRDGDDDPNNDSDTADIDPICFTIYNEFSPNGDGVNDTFVIDCIENFPTSKLEIYNRWGNIVYETTGYRNDWEGTSNGRAVVDADGQLPVGTYYYVIDFMNGTEPRTGWLYINR